MHIDDIENKLTRHGKRMTQARRSIIEMLLHIERHVTADELYQQLKQLGSPVGRMTVFRTLELLGEVGVVRPVYQGSGAAHFVLLENGHHHHLVCRHCAKTVEFVDCGLSADLDQRLGAEFSFQIEGCIFRTKTIKDSGRKRSQILVFVDHRFWSIAIMIK